MSQMTSTAAPTRRVGEPAWEIAELFPLQGAWDESDYFALDTGRLVEFDSGVIEVLPVPTKNHQLIMFFICKMLDAFVLANNLGGKVYPAGYPVKVDRQKYREPDVVYLTAEQDALSPQEYSAAAEIVVEVVSKSDPDRDYKQKVVDYARGGIPEYWIVDPDKRKVLVLRLEAGSYVTHGLLNVEDVLTSTRLQGFSLPVKDIFAVMAANT